MARETPARASRAPEPGSEVDEAADTSESGAAEPKRARAERRRAVQDAFEREQLAKLGAHMAEERRRYEREVELRRRDEARGAPPGWVGEVGVGPEATPELRDFVLGDHP